MNFKDYEYKLLDIWSGHITLATHKTLKEGIKTNSGISDEISYEAWSVYGWVIVVEDIAIEAATNWNMPELAKLLNLAYQNDYQFLKLDWDGLPLSKDEGFPTFHW